MRSYLWAVAIGIAVDAGSGGMTADIVQDKDNSAYAIKYFEPITQTFTAVDVQITTLSFAFLAMNPGDPSTDPLVVKLTDMAGRILLSQTYSGPSTTMSDTGFTDLEFGFSDLMLNHIYTLSLSTIGNSRYLGVTASQDDYYAGGKSNLPQGSDLNSEFSTTPPMYRSRHPGLCSLPALALSAPLCVVTEKPLSPSLDSYVKEKSYGQRLG